MLTVLGLIYRLIGLIFVRAKCLKREFCHPIFRQLQAKSTKMMAGAVMAIGSEQVGLLISYENFVPSKRLELLSAN